ncbi:MAG: prepilin-type N-terminal cleavage/methylation domain-containing protein [Deltaproteobacteria bacterium]|nr:prepilin-type N-terminal cleavage/methylation domain-containing protein [Deltaproteobacteria bacterium]MBW2050616.1 prepilin-type N-terminal cleavage/methylation domain-containing protein [Deltaproteobacteria bacterium]MBW2139490.1 prepilin-type N-terminal cleavage/methylation domain-containing protein [Deltaproteobacteria bacterium]MBW2322561.1 prepilin-type N-terminal cleavage/methylation domain-containing protein [Deltaproteobacteria bacterium]
MNKRYTRKGFTLIELLIVVCIIGVLAAIAIPQFARYRTNSMNAAVKASLHQLAKAQEDYYLQNQTYTVNRATLRNMVGWTVETSVTITILAASTESWSATARHLSSPNTFTYTSSGGGLL